jgi:cytochrome c biogenesis protein CcmG/thiol:disulfide interchange protein DsbE
MIGRVTAILVLAAFVGLLAYGLASQSPSDAIDDALSNAQTAAAPPFELDVLDAGTAPERLRPVVERATRDGRVSLDELRGVPVVLNFWASWCPPCRDEAPVLEQVWRETGRTGVLFVGLDSRDVRSDARAFLKEFDVSYLNIREGDKTVSRRYGATGLPETFFIDRRSRIVGHVIGAVKREQLRAGIAAARAGDAAGTVQGGARRSTR